MLSRFFDRKSSAGLLIDEAHNLPDRAREMYSARLSGERVHDLRMRIVDLWSNLTYSGDEDSSLMPYVMLSVPSAPDAPQPISVLFEVFAGGELLADAEEPWEASDFSTDDSGVTAVEVYRTVRASEEISVGPEFSPEQLLLRATVTDSAGNRLTGEFGFK